MPTLDIECTVECRECGAELELITKLYDGVTIIKVDPCQDCIDNAVDREVAESQESMQRTIDDRDESISDLVRQVSELAKDLDEKE